MNTTATPARRNVQLPLQVRALSYQVQGRQLLSPLNLSIDSTGISIMLGPNGAGKSLLLRLLHGLLKPDSGSILWNQQSIGELSVRMQQSMVFQKPVLLRRSVAANIDYVLKLRNKASTQRRDELLHSAGLADKSAQPARSLSGGEQQRLAIARALATSPAVLFLDEPTASLDPEATSHIEHQVHQAARAGIKVIMVTHDLSQARRLAHDVIFMSYGTIAEHSSAGLFFSNPASVAGKTWLSSYLQPSQTNSPSHD